MFKHRIERRVASHFPYIQILFPSLCHKLYHIDVVVHIQLFCRCYFVKWSTPFYFLSGSNIFFKPIIVAPTNHIIISAKYTVLIGMWPIEQPLLIDKEIERYTTAFEESIEPEHTSNNHFLIVFHTVEQQLGNWLIL